MTTDSIPTAEQFWKEYDTMPAEEFGSRQSARYSPAVEGSLPFRGAPTLYVKSSEIGVPDGRTGCGLPA